MWSHSKDDITISPEYTILGEAKNVFKYLKHILIVLISLKLTFSDEPS